MLAITRGRDQLTPWSREAAATIRPPENQVRAIALNESALLGPVHKRSGMHKRSGIVTVPAPQRVRTRIEFGFRWSRSVTVLTRLRFVGLSRSATVTLACHGPRCPLHVRRGTARHLRRFVTQVIGRDFRAGQRIDVTVAAPHRRAERGEVTIRRDARPRVRLL